MSFIARWNQVQYSTKTNKYPLYILQISLLILQWRITLNFFQKANFNLQNLFIYAEYIVPKLSYRNIYQCVAYAGLVCGCSPPSSCMARYSSIRACSQSSSPPDNTQTRRFKHWHWYNCLVCGNQLISCFIDFNLKKIELFWDSSTLRNVWSQTHGGLL